MTINFEPIDIMLIYIHQR